MMINKIVRLALTLGMIVAVVASSWSVARWIVGGFMLLSAAANETAARMAHLHRSGK
jgi:hypothetical protein